MPVPLGADHDRLGDQRLLRAVEIAHERRGAALVEELLALDVGVAVVGQHHLGAGVEERQLAQPVLDRGVVELDHGEGGGRRQERHLGAALAVLARADDLERGHRHAVVELDLMLLALAPDAALERRRQRIDDRHADAVQAARNLVGVLVELAAGVQLGEHDLGGRALGIVVVVLLDAGRDAAAIVAHRARAVGVQRDQALRCVSGQHLVDGVVDDLVDHVVQARPVVGVADVHAGALADGVEPLQHLDRILAVIIDGGELRGGLCGHARRILETSGMCRIFIARPSAAPAKKLAFWHRHPKQFLLYISFG